MKFLPLDNTVTQHPPRPVEPDYGYNHIQCSFYTAMTNHQMSTKQSASRITKADPHWTHKTVTVLNISIVLLLVLLPVGEAGECSLRRSVHTVRFRRCVPKRVLSFNCRGTCNSYSSLNPADLLQVVRNCNCCKETGFVHARIPLRCPKPNGERGYRDAHVRVKVPTGCSCRPCAPLPTIQAGEFL